MGSEEALAGKHYPIGGAFCNDDQTVVTLLAPSLKRLTHCSFPILHIWRGFGNKYLQYKPVPNNQY